MACGNFTSFFWKGTCPAALVKIIPTEKLEATTVAVMDGVKNMQIILSVEIFKKLTKFS